MYVYLIYLVPRGQKGFDKWCVHKMSRICAVEKRSYNYRKLRDSQLIIALNFAFHVNVF